MSFEEYLASKRINSSAYKASEPEQWSTFSAIFEQMHPKSFTMQKLNLINGIRRQFPCKEEVVESEQTKPKVARPAIKPKISGVKPKMGKPVMKAKKGEPAMKPKMKPDSSEGNQEVVEPKIVMKPKMVRPVIKPKPKDPTE